MDFFRKAASPAAILLLICSVTWGQAPAGQAPASAAPKLLQPGQASPQLDWRFAPPNASLLGGIEVQSLLQAPLLAELLTAGSQGDPNATMLVGMLQAMLMQVDRIQFAAIDNGTNTPDGVFLVTGTLDDGLFQLLSASSKQQAQAPDGIPVPEKPWDWRRINPQSVLFGVSDMLDSAEARIGSPEILPVEQGVQLDKLLSPDQDLWISGMVPDAPATAGVNQQIDGFALGLNFGDNLNIEAAAIIPDPGQAQALIGLLQAMISLQPNQFAGKLETSVENTVAHARLSLTAADVLKLIEQGQAMSAAGTAQDQTAADPPSPNGAGAGAGQEPSEAASPADGVHIIGEEQPGGNNQ